MLCKFTPHDRRRWSAFRLAVRLMFSSPANIKRSCATCETNCEDHDD